nr:odorant receptor 23.1 [Papilio memnon]
MAQHTNTSKNFEAFIPHFETFSNLGYYKLMKPTSRTKEILHYYYRILVWIIFTVYNVQHVLRVIEVRNDIMDVVNTMYVFLTLLNSLGKQVAFNYRTKRVDKIIDAIKGPVFAPSNKYHDKLMTRNASEMMVLLRCYQLFAVFLFVMWMAFPIMIRLSGQEVSFSMYYPFDTNKQPAFLLVVIYVAIHVVWLSFATVSMDCLIVAFYMQGRLQFQMLRNNLRHLVDTEDEIEYGDDDETPTIPHKDIHTDTFKDLFQRRLVQCVKRHQLTVWLVKETESIFAEALVMQFIVVAWIICMTVFKLVAVNVLSAEFITMIIYLACILIQLFLFCYYGTQLTHESDLVSQAIYEAEWMVLPPQMARPLLIMMARCYQPISLYIAYVVPMSIESFISVVKSSYSLYTFLDRK